MTISEVSLTFAVPTWNRADRLRVCVESIASQHVDGVEIIISNHGSDDHTATVCLELMQKYSFVTAAYLVRSEKPDYSDAFKYLFTLPQTEWTWTFGDDDILLPGQLAKILPLLERDYDFIHVAEKKRSSGTGQLVKADLMSLCNAYGLIDMTGFITGNIVRSAKLKAASELKSWPIYARSAFVQSLAIYEVCHASKAAFLDWPIIDSQDESQTEETCATWTRQDIPTRYFHLIDGLQDMRERGIIKECDPAFFRYLSYFLWDRFVQNIISSFTTTQACEMTPMLIDLFGRTLALTDFLKEHNRKRYRDELLEVRDAMDDVAYSMKVVLDKEQHMNFLLNTHSVERFPWEYIRSNEKAA